MKWDCLNPADIVRILSQDSPVAARQEALAMVKGKIANAFRDGKNWADERLWFWDEPECIWSQDLPFNLSPILREGFCISEPNNMFEQAEFCLANGGWELGWNYYDFRHQIEQGRRQMKSFGIPHWDGKTPPKRLLVHAEQGAGDTIMFARYLMELDRRGIKSDFAVPENLWAVMSTLDYRGNIVSVIDEYLYDFHLPVGSLPLALGIYEPLQCGSYLRSEWTFAGESGGVGVCWAGSDLHPRNAARCLTLEQVMEHVPQGARVMSLQMGETRQQLAFAPWIVDLTSTIRDWQDTARILGGLDLLVTADTGIAHLAGAIGTPVKLLVKEPVEWRWQKGDTTPWYQNMQIVRVDDSRGDSSISQSEQVAEVH